MGVECCFYANPSVIKICIFYANFNAMSRVCLFHLQLSVVVALRVNLQGGFSLLDTLFHMTTTFGALGPLRWILVIL